MNRVLVASDRSGDKAMQAHLKKVGLSLLHELSFRSVILEVAILGDRKMRDLKKRYYPREKAGRSARRGARFAKAPARRDAPARVLAFPEAPRPLPFPGCPRFLGEVYLNRKYAGRSRDGRVRLLMHGVLHLVGYRHDRKRDIVAMERRERSLCKKLLS